MSLFFIHPTARIQMSNILLGQEFIQEYESEEWRRVFQSSWLETWSWSGQDGPSTLFDTCSVLFDLSIFYTCSTLFYTRNVLFDLSIFLYMQCIVWPVSFLYTQCIVWPVAFYTCSVLLYLSLLRCIAWPVVIITRGPGFYAWDVQCTNAHCSVMDGASYNVIKPVLFMQCITWPVPYKCNALLDLSLFLQCIALPVAFYTCSVLHYLSFFIHAVYCVTCHAAYCVTYPFLYMQCIALPVAFYTCSVLHYLSFFIHAVYCVTCHAAYCVTYPFLYMQCIALPVAFYTCSVLHYLSFFLYMQCIALPVAFYTCSVLHYLSFFYTCSVLRDMSCSVLRDISLFIHAVYCLTCHFLYMQYWNWESCEHVYSQLLHMGMKHG